ncbi:MAG: hypothetical protein ACREE4_08120 [Stellaceae bacterium]
MLTIADQLRELRAETAGCLLTRRERAQAKAELKRLLAMQAEIDRARDAALTAQAPPD